jgi:hypothetical protein
MASPPPELDGFGVKPTHVGSCAAHRPRSTRFRAGFAVTGLPDRFTPVTPSDLARRARAVWQCQHVPPSSGPLATVTDIPRIRLPPASSGRCDDPTRTVSHRPSTNTAPRGAQLPHEESCRCAEISTSSRSRRFAALSRLISANSALVTPPARRRRPELGDTTPVRSPY